MQRWRTATLKGAPLSDRCCCRNRTSERSLLRNDQRRIHVIPIGQGSAPRIKAENAPELASRYLDVPNMPWQETRFPSIRIKVLYAERRVITTALFKLDPGAVVPLHERTALEQTYVLEGTLEE
jgi:hypothetical protein